MIYIERTYIDFYNEEDEYHRIGGPAFIAREIQSWYKDGKYHRLEGPAIIGDGYVEWCIEDEWYYDENEFYDKLYHYQKGSEF